MSFKRSLGNAGAGPYTAPVPKRKTSGINIGVNDVDGPIDDVHGVHGTGVHQNGVNGTAGLSHHSEVDLDLDVLVVGAGFAGVYLLHKLRKEGFSTKIVEAGSDLGGIWHWNSYPGARVDSQYPIYAYSMPEVYKDWTWTEQYPGWAELRRYFGHVDKKLDIKKDTIFNTKVVSATFNAETNKWTVETDVGLKIRCSIFIAAIGFAARRHFPDWKGLDSFSGHIHHSSFWPDEGVDVRGKKVAVIGTGATGIQIAQTCARDAGELTVFQRTPNLCCPMKQEKISVEQQEKDKENYPEIFKERLEHYAGFMYSSQDVKTFSHSPEEREAWFEKLWQMGGFRYLANNYIDMLADETANAEAYKFWRKKILARVPDPEKAAILAPEVPPHVFGGKRLSLEQDFYEQMSKPNISLVDIKKNPVKEVVPEGIITEDGKLHEFDIIALATGFDSITGGMKDIHMTGLDGQLLAEKWREGTWTYLGISTSGFPNFFFLYGPQGPTAFSNGPSCVEPQGDWVVDVLKSMREKGLTRIDPKEEAERGWKATVRELHSRSLRDKVDGWYNGANIPGKPKEPLNYAGGIPL